MIQDFSGERAGETGAAGPLEDDKDLTILVYDFKDYILGTVSFMLWTSFSD